MYWLKEMEDKLESNMPLLEDILNEVDEYDFEMLNVGRIKFVTIVNTFALKNIYLVFIVMVFLGHEKNNVLRKEDAYVFID